VSGASIDDHAYMARALELATRGLTTTMPNPRVGAVLVRNGEIVGEGFHGFAGGPHAEIHALRAAGEQARGATLYVTLEPCAHQGRTPPCVDALIDAKIARAVIAHEDPFPRVAGRGVARLNAAGIDTLVGIGAGPAKALNAGFLLRQTRGKGLVRLKLAMSLDGRTALESGQSKWITSAAARADVQRLRAQSCAIVTGAASVLADDPHLTVRQAPERRKQPLKVILDRHLRTPASARLFDEHDGVLIYNASDRERPDLIARGALLIEVSRSESATQLDEVLRDLTHRGANEILIECGATLAGALIDARLIDELIVYQAPLLLGHRGRPLSMLSVDTLTGAPGFVLRDARQIGPDLKLTLIPQ
jgi:diaminohydroxyphosphoribosylaminopyrimidine deaminase / 5-amino-6-(5-phosphoribosylamino)uracil reductase